MTKTLQHLTANIVGKARFAVMEGRDYIVLPVTILVEGVHAGSNGPLLYTLEEMNKWVQAWNHKPVVVYHPKDSSGEFTSADSPAILSTYKVGVLMANKIEGNAQVAEAWLEKSRVMEVDPRIMEAIEKGLVVEVSTGLFSDNEEVPGTWNGEEYDSIARNFRPDHLALLPDLVGACSVKDGCGMFTAAQSMTFNQARMVQNQFARIFDEVKPLEKKKDDQTVNELSHGDIYYALSEAIREQLHDNLEKAMENLPDNTPRPMMPYIDMYGVYDDYCVYYANDSYFKQEYSVAKDKVTLKGGPVAVERSVSYTPISNCEEKTMSEENKGGQTTANCDCPNVKALVDGILASNGQFKETDREWLVQQPEDILTKIASNMKVEEEQKVEKVLEKEIKQVENSQQKPKQMTVEEYIANAPGPLKAVLARGVAAHNAERKRLIDIITSNERNTFTPEKLGTFDIPDLQALAGLAMQDQPKETEKLNLFDYLGSAGAPNYNAQGGDEEALELPTMNFGKSK